MPITYNPTTITQIANGQAITATNLNAPSVDLQTRTVEIQNDTKYQEYLDSHSTDAVVKVVPHLDSNTESKLIITSRIKDDGSTSNKLRSYTMYMSGASLSVYAKAVPGSRFIIPGTAFSSFFSDSSNLAVKSSDLFVPGDGIYLKVPTKQFRSSDSEVSYQENYLPQTIARSTGNTYLTDQVTTAIAQADLVKLPRRTLIEIIQSGLTATTFINSINVASSFVSGTTYTASINATTNVLSIEKGGTPGYLLRVVGVQKARCTIEKVYNNTAGTGIVLEVTGATSPIYTALDATSGASLTLAMYQSDDSTAAGTNNTIITDASTYTVAPKDLDVGYMYLPLVRLTETTMEVGDRSFSLVRGAAQDGAAADNVFNIPDFHGAPIEYQHSAWTEGTKGLVHNLISNTKEGIKGQVSIQGIFSPSSNVFSADFSRTEQYQSFIRNLTSGSVVYFQKATFKVIDTIVTASSPSALVFTAVSTFRDHNSTFLSTGELAITETITDKNYRGYGSEIELVPSGPDAAESFTKGTQSNDTPTNKSTCIATIAATGGGNITAGSVVVTLDFFVE
jgi:hypothetical protein